MAKSAKKTERFTLNELDSLRLAVMHTRVYVHDAKTNKMLDKLQAKVERFIVDRGRKLQAV